MLYGYTMEGDLIEFPSDEMFMVRCTNIVFSFVENLSLIFYPYSLPFCLLSFFSFLFVVEYISPIFYLYVSPP